MTSSHQWQKWKFVIQYHGLTTSKTVVVGYESHQTTLCEAPKGPVNSPSLQQNHTATKVELLMSQAATTNKHPCSRVKNIKIEHVQQKWLPHTNNKRENFLFTTMTGQHTKQLWQGTSLVKPHSVKPQRAQFTVKVYNNIPQPQKLRCCWVMIWIHN